MARFSGKILAEDRVRLQKNRPHLKILAAIILFSQIVSYGCLPKPGEPLEASQFDYLPGRESRIAPLIVKHLRQQSANQHILEALECLANSPVHKVIIGAGESPDFRDLLTEVFAEFKPVPLRCLPLSGEWQIIATEELPSPERDTDKSLTDELLEGATQGAGQGLLLYVYPLSCMMTLGMVCPVGKNYSIKISTDVSFPNGQINNIFGAGYSREWTITAWKYKVTRDEVLAKSFGDALMDLAAHYSIVVSVGSFGSNE